MSSDQATALPREREGVRGADVAVALAITMFCVVVGQHQVPTASDARSADHLQMAVVTLTCVPLAFRRPWPVPAALFSTAACAWYVALGYTGGPVLLVPLVAMFWA